MATTLTRNLKLKISSNFDDISKYNLNKIDTLASLFQINSNEQAVIRSKTGIVFEPNSPDIGGTGAGGEISFGSVDQPINALNINASSISFSSGISLSDQAVGGDKKLSLNYKSDLLGSVDTVSSRILNLDMNGDDRNLVLGGNFTLLGGNLAISLSGLSTGQVLTYNAGSDIWENNDPSASTSSELVESWDSGATKLVTHGFNSRNIQVQVFDENYKTIGVDSVTRTSLNTITLIASNAPTGVWTILVKKLD